MGNPKSPQHTVICGSLSNLPQEQRKVIRIFLSSTFTDMKVERNMLMSTIFPRLKKYCQESYELEFQVVDMRWGVQDQAADDHSTSELCTREILNCQRESAGPNFVCLLGDRYGTRYLKRYITEEHWTILVSRIRSAEVKQLLDIWYKLDTNSATPQRVLQPISSVENGSVEWEESSALMYSAIREAAIQAKDDGELAAEAAQTFIRSVTEEEIDCAGILSNAASENRPKCLAFFRHINNINLQHEKANRFIDITKTKEEDSEKQGLLNKLKEQVKESLPQANIKEYSVSWSSGGIHADDHKEYLQNFGEDFYIQVKNLVDSAVESQDQSLQDVYANEVCREVLNHSKQALDKLSKVVPRSNILDQVEDYITGNSDHPLIVHGHSGCGKTSIMASVAKEASGWMSAINGKLETTVLLRFLGTSPFSSDIEHLLHSLTSQLKIINEEDTDADVSQLAAMSLKDLIQEFHTEIESFDTSETSRLVIVIDSIDQLTKNDVAFNLSWLPPSLPKGVRLVISTLPDIYGILKSAQSLDIPKENFVEVKALDETSAWTIIDKWLEIYNRKITDNQRAAVTESFKGKYLPPLYIKLVFDILIKWRSYSQADSIPTDVIACMDQLFTNLESTHGKLQVRLALAYLTCCPGGISEAELEDTLSIDDEFLSAVYQYHIPPLRRIPPTLWVRMKNDIKGYLVEKESHGVAALFWYHRQFIEYATRRFASENGDNTKHCMASLCDYFTSKWVDNPKPFHYTQEQMEKLQLSESSASALRYVAAQPTKYGRHKFNGRKISVLSQLWSSSVMKEQVYPNSAAYIMDIEFLTGKFVNDSWTNIDAQLSSMLGYMSPDVEGEEERYKVEYSYLHEVLKMYSGLIAMAPLALPAQLFACLQDKYNLSPAIAPSGAALPNLAWFLTQLINGAGLEICPLLPVSSILTPPGGMQKVSSLQTSLTKIFPFEYQGKSCVAIFSDEMLVYTLGSNGGISELLTVILPGQPDYGELITLSVDENYILGVVTGNFYLISLENKRVEVTCESVEVDPADAEIVLYAEVMHAFLNPLINGRDSIMVYGGDTETAFIYSFKLRKVVWYHHIPDEDEETGEKPEEMYNISLHDTDEADVKSLIIVFTKRTEFYKVKLLADGGAGVTKDKERKNKFEETQEEKLKIKALSSLQQGTHGSQQMDLLLPELPNNKFIILSDKTASKEGLWSYYEISRRCDVFMSGKMRNGDDIIAIYSGFDSRPLKTHLLELYSARSYDSLKLSAAFLTTENPSFVYLVPNSDVLIVGVKKKVFVYFLCQQTPPVIDVTLVFELEISTDAVDDLMADPKGFMVSVSAMESSCKIWDLTAYSKSTSQSSNPRVVSASYCNGLSHLNAPDNCPLVLQSDGHLWDLHTNEILLPILPGHKSNESPVAAICFDGMFEWKHTVAIMTGRSCRVIHINPVAGSPDETTSELWKTFEMDGVTEALNLGNAMIGISDESGMLYYLQCSLSEENMFKSFQLTTTNGSTSDDPPCSWTTVGFSAIDYCFADSVFFVVGDEIDPDDEDADSVRCILLYDTSSFNLLQKLTDTDFSYAAYFKKHNLAVFMNSDDGLRVMDVSNVNSLIMENVLSEEDYGKFCMLESYGRNEHYYNNEFSPYFYVESEEKGFLRLDVRKYRSWANGEGVVCLGPYPSKYIQCRISYDGGYLLGVVSEVPRLQLCRVTDSRVELLGEILCQGDIDSFAFTKDGRYVIIVLGSGEVVIVKVLDPAFPNFNTELAALKCTQQPLCKTMEETIQDSRWTTMAALTGATGPERDADTLYNFVKECARTAENKCKMAAVDTRLFQLRLAAKLKLNILDAMDKDTKKFIPTIKIPASSTDVEATQEEKSSGAATIDEKADKRTDSPAADLTSHQQLREGVPLSSSSTYRHTDLPSPQPSDSSVSHQSSAGSTRSPAQKDVDGSKESKAESVEDATPRTPGGADSIAELEPEIQDMSELTSNIVLEQDFSYESNSISPSVRPLLKLPEELKHQIQSFAQDTQKEEIPKNLKLYLDLATEEKEKRLDAAHAELSQLRVGSCCLQ